MNIKTDGSIPSIKNQHGLTIPWYIVSFYGLRDNVINTLQNRGFTYIYEKHGQDVYNLLCEMYIEKHDEEHPIQQCKTYSDVYKLRLKDRYNFLKNKIEKKGTICFDFPDIYRLQGFISHKEENEEDSYITVYETCMTFDDGYDSFELEKSSLQKMLESLNIKP